MKKFIITICACFGLVHVATAETMNINWYVDDSLYDTSTCTVGGDLILPTTPTKYGHHFVGWDGDYQFLEYIETDGASYIILKGYATNDTSFEMLVTKKCSETGKGLYGAASSNSWKLGSGIETHQNPGALYLLNGAETNTSINITDLETHIIQNKNVYTFINANGTQTFTQPGGKFQTTHQIRMAAIQAYNSVRPCASVWKYFNVSNMVDSNGNVLPDVNLVPVRRISDNKIGMYDKINRRFYPAVGNGSFTAGPAI